MIVFLRAKPTYSTPVAECLLHSIKLKGGVYYYCFSFEHCVANVITKNDKLFLTVFVL